MSEITFKINDTGVSSFMEKLKKQAAELNSESLRGANLQKQNASELLKLIEDKNRALQRGTKLDLEAAQTGVQNWVKERQEKAKRQLSGIAGHLRDQYKSGQISESDYKKRLRIFSQYSKAYNKDSIEEKGQEQLKHLKEQAKNSQTLIKYMGENVHAIRNTSKEQVQAIKAGKQVPKNDLPPEQQAIVKKLTEETLKGESKTRASLSRMWDMSAGLAINRIGDMVAQMPSAKSELEFVKPMLSMLGAGMGGLAGSAADAVAGTSILGFSLGQTKFGEMGIAIGSKTGEFAGAALERHIRSNDMLNRAIFGSSAVSGKLYGRVDASEMGLDFIETEARRNSYLGAKGSSISNKELLNLISLERGYGVSSSSIGLMYELSRSNKSSDRNTSAIIAGVKDAMFGSGDRTFLNEFLTKNYAQLQKTMINTQEYVSSGMVVSISKGLSSLGGQFNYKDPRSVGLSTQLQGSLANPGSDTSKALAFHIMKQKNPNMSFLDIQMEIQKGMSGGGGTYLQSVMEYIIGQGGDESYQTNNVASFFGLQGNLSAAQSLMKAYKSGTLPKQFKDYNLYGNVGTAQSEAEGYTSKYMRSTAEIENAYIDSAVQGLAVMTDKTLEMFGTVMDELAIEMKKIVKRTLSLDSDTPKPKPNEVKGP